MTCLVTDSTSAEHGRPLASNGPPVSLGRYISHETQPSCQKHFEQALKHKLLRADRYSPGRTPAATRVQFFCGGDPEHRNDSMSRPTHSAHLPWVATCGVWEALAGGILESLEYGFKKTPISMHTKRTRRTRERPRFTIALVWRNPNPGNEATKPTARTPMSPTTREYTDPSVGTNSPTRDNS